MRLEPISRPHHETKRASLKTPNRLAVLLNIALLFLAACGPAPVRVPIPGHTSVPGVTTEGSSSAIQLPDSPPNAASRPNNIYPGTGTLVGPPASQPSSGQRPNTKDGIQLAFTDVDITQVVASVLGEALGLNYSIDPSVKGTMSLRSSRALSAEELLPALEAALRVQELALVQVNGTYHVLPVKDAPRRVTSINPPSDRTQAGFSIQIVPLQFTSPAEMEKILQPFAPPGGVMKVDEARNLLLLAGSSRELETMLDVVKTFDVDWLAGMSYGFFNLNYVDAKTAVTELSEIFADPKSPLAGVVRLVPITRLNTILVITPQQKYLQAVETWIKRLDVGGTSAGRRIYVYDVQNGRAEDLAKSLNKILSLPTTDDDLPQQARQRYSMNSSSTPGYSSNSGVNAGLAPGFNPSTSSNGGPSGINNLYPPLLGSSAGQFGFNQNTAKQGDLRIVANNDSNSLLVLATPAEFSVIEAALTRLDAPSRQVLIEASLAEVTLNDELRYGIQWNYNGKKGPITLSDAASGAVSQSFPGLSYLFTGSTNIRAVLNALETVTTVRVISSPKLVTLNNHEAQLQVGDEVPVATQSAVSVVNPDAPIVNSVQMQDTGVILSVTPRVNKNGLVEMDITQEVSNSVPTTTSGIDSPTIQQRKLSTTVVVKNGDTIALGGLITESKSKSKSGVPYLQKIPFLGALFRDTDNQTIRTELILLITPRVMRDDNEFQNVMDDLRNEFKTLKDVFKEPPKP
jgi:general secretion pathway protein D